MKELDKMKQMQAASTKIGEGYSKILEGLSMLEPYATRMQMAGSLVVMNVLEKMMKKFFIDTCPEYKKAMIDDEVDELSKDLNITYKRDSG